MTNSEIVAKASVDPNFREYKLSNLRYFKNVGVGLAVCFAALGVFATVHACMTTTLWDEDTGWAVGLILVAFTVRALTKQIKALESLEPPSEAQRPHQPPSTTITCPVK